MSSNLRALREAIRAHYLAPEVSLLEGLVDGARVSARERVEAQQSAAEFVRDARANAGRSGLIDKFLQEYGLSTAEGVTLMRLAEALLRTPDATTANALIEDKIDAGDWSSHKGKSPFPLVNFSTRALMLTAAWLDDVEAKDPMRRMVKSTKTLLDRIGEPVIRASVAQAMRIMGEHFVLGETIDDAMRRGRAYKEQGYFFSFDMLGEAAHTRADAEKYFRDYAEAIAAISAHAKSDAVADNPGISVKLSALHPRYEYGQRARVRRELGGAVKELALAAKKANLGFNIDAEEADRLDLSLDLIETLMRDDDLADWNGFGVVVQAYQRRAPFVIDWLAALARDADRRIMVRLVKGAYWDGEIKRAQIMGLESYPVFTRKVLTDISFLTCARRLFDNADIIYPQFATHNALTAALVRRMAGDGVAYELQRLHGMGEALHDRLIERGARSRIYAPVGGHKELLPYLVRRLLENGANSSFVNQLIDPDLSVDDIVTDPFVEIDGLAPIANPAIPAPRDHLGGRPAAKGWDETDPDTASRLETVASKDLAMPAPSTENTLSTVDPVRNTALGFFDMADDNKVNDACRRAQEAQSVWAARLDRSDLLRDAADALEARGEEFIHLAVREAGKSIPDAIAEVREAVDFLRYYADQAPTVRGAPLGVVACISPWNFPLAIFLGQVSAALAVGNAVVAKPAEQTPAIAIRAVALMHEAGIPDDVLHLVIGDGPTVGAPLVAHEAVNGVVFTGSTLVAKIIAQNLVDSGKPNAPLIAETGGINAMIVDSTALLEQAVSDAIASAFQSAGQRCSACRLVCVQEDVAEQFNTMLAGAMAELTVGDPALLKTDVGPVIDDEARRTIADHIAAMKKNARLIGEAPTPPPDLGGYFIRPAAFELSAIDDLKEEIFGPVLHVVTYKAENLEGLIADINALGFGLTMGVHSRIDETMETIAGSARIGNIYVNRNQIGAVVGVQPFGGEGLSGAGPKAGGPHYLSAMTRRERASGGSKISIVDVPLDNDARRMLGGAEAGFRHWSLSGLDRGAVLARAAEMATGSAKSALQYADDLFRKEFAEQFVLPGPTGESNTLRLRGRGVALCLGGAVPENVLTQTAMALAAGNAVLMTGDDDGLAETMSKAGCEAVFKLDMAGAVSNEILFDDRIRLVALDSDDEIAEMILSTLAKRPGPIAPLLTTADAPWRYATERTLTINTTAAGGDVRLLSLPD